MSIQDHEGNGEVPKPNGGDSGVTASPAGASPEIVKNKRIPIWFSNLNPEPVCEHPDRKRYGWGLCRNCYVLAWDRAHPEAVKVRKRKNHLREYNLSEEQFSGFIEKQNGVCAICGEPPKGNLRAKRLQIDHDHETGEVRGLLCPRCNLAIGHLREREELFQKAIIYLSDRWHTKYYRMIMLIAMLAELVLLAVLVALEALHR